MEIRIAQIEPAHAAASRTVIARAFADDPLLEWLFPPARWAVDERLDAIAMFYGPTVDAYAVAQTGHVALQGETVVGVGLWGVPGSVPVAGAGGPALLPTGAGVARILLGERAGLLGHGLRSARGAEPVPRTPYLHDLAVSGGLRGRGIGARGCPSDQLPVRREAQKKPLVISSDSLARPLSRFHSSHRR